MMGIDHDEAQDKFGFLLRRLRLRGAAARRASRSAGTASPRCWPGWTRSARSSRSRSRAVASTR